MKEYNLNKLKLTRVTNEAYAKCAEEKEKFDSMVNSELPSKRKERVLDAETILYEIGRIEKFIAPLPKKYWDGISVEIKIGAGKFPKAYKYKAMGDCAVICYKKNRWVLLSVSREDVKNEKPYRFEFTKEQREKFLDEIISGFCG